MRNILIMKFPYSSLYGGGEQHTIQLVESLIPKGFNFYLLSSCRVLLREFKARKWHAQRGWSPREPVSKGALLLWPFLAPLAFAAFTLYLIYYRIVHDTTVLYCLSLNEKIIATIPARLLGMDVVWMEHVTFERWLSKNPLRFLYRAWSRFVRIIAVSRVVHDQLVETIRVQPERIQIIYNGIDLKRFSMRDRRWEDAARFNIGCIARLENEKGIEFLIQAVKIIREFIPYVRLIIVGEGGERRKLTWLAERLNLKEYVQWVGYQKAIEKWYGYFDVYVLPSVVRESFGITLVEAMASGVPAVASRIGGTPEIVEHKVTGLLAEPGNSRDLADKLLYLYNNRESAKDMSVLARKRVEERFSLERMTRDFYLLFRK